MSDFLKEFDSLVDSLIEQDFKDLSKKAKNNLNWLVKYSGGDRKRILKNLDEIFYYAATLKMVTENLEDEGFDAKTAMKKGKVRIRF